MSDYWDHNTDAIKRAMMKNAIARNSHIPFVKRLTLSKEDSPSLFLGQDSEGYDVEGSHELGSYGNYVLPNIVEEDNDLKQISEDGNFNDIFQYHIGDGFKNALWFDNPDNAMYFANENYKEVSPAFKKEKDMKNLKIPKFRYGGKIPQYHNGGYAHGHPHAQGNDPIPQWPLSPQDEKIARDLGKGWFGKPEAFIDNQRKKYLNSVTDPNSKYYDPYANLNRLEGDVGRGKERQIGGPTIMDDFHDSHKAASYDTNFTPQFGESGTGQQEYGVYDYFTMEPDLPDDETNTIRPSTTMTLGPGSEIDEYVNKTKVLGEDDTYDDPDDPTKPTIKTGTTDSSYGVDRDKMANIYHASMLGTDVGLLINNLTQQPPPRQNFSRTALSRVDVDLNPFDIERSKNAESSNRSFRDARQYLGGQASNMQQVIQSLNTKDQENLRNIGNREYQASNQERMMNIEISNKEQMINDQQKDKEMQVNHALMAQFYRERGESISKSVGAIKQDLKNMADYSIKKDYMDRSEKFSRDHATAQNAINRAAVLTAWDPKEDPQYTSMVGDRQAEILNEVQIELNEKHAMSMPDENKLEKQKLALAKQLGAYKTFQDNLGDEPSADDYTITEKPILDDYEKEPEAPNYGSAEYSTSEDGYEAARNAQAKYAEDTDEYNQDPDAYAQKRYDADLVKYEATKDTTYDDAKKAYDAKVANIKAYESSNEVVQDDIDKKEAYIKDLEIERKKRGYDRIPAEVRKELGIPDKGKMMKEIMEMLKNNSLYE